MRTKIYPSGFTLIPLGNLVIADWNYKLPDPERDRKLTENLKRNGQVENLTVRRLKTGYYEVVNGNHRLEVMNLMKWKSPVMCFNCGTISDDKAQRLAIELNETRYETDNIKLAQLIENILKNTSIDDLESTVNFSKSDIESMQKLLSFDFEKYGEPTSPDGQGRLTIKVTYDEKDNAIRDEISKICEKYETAEMT